ncbi:hypothetical protein LDG_6697 [Legionella drancourtii LLAP12]|uniref:Transposase DDE domain-containing protein n=1 Tax=Legionella drancourtii LLAP12 TaxID=658187 RepID=G9EN75_9GAMM|nr:hypothetical protein LDG_6697 [Legionella drancourtii LLAP12]
MGEWCHEVKPILIKTHRRLAISLFRYGLDFIVDILMNLFYKKTLFGECLNRIRLEKPGSTPLGYAV